MSSVAATVKLGYRVTEAIKSIRGTLYRKPPVHEVNGCKMSLGGCRVALEALVEVTCIHTVISASYNEV
jgi:hypothetical protein